MMIFILCSFSCSGSVDLWAWLLKFVGIDASMIEVGIDADHTPWKSLKSSTAKLKSDN
jgi:hypothetical protein